MKIKLQLMFLVLILISTLGVVNALEISESGTYVVSAGDTISLNSINAEIMEIHWASQGDTEPRVWIKSDSAQVCDLAVGEECKFFYGAVSHPLSYNLNVMVDSIDKNSLTAKIIVKEIYEPIKYNDYIIEQDFGDITYNKGSLEEGISADMIDVLTSVFGGFVGGASARYTIQDTPYDQDVEVAVAEFDHEISFNEFNNFVNKIKEDENDLDFDYDPANVEGSAPNSQILIISNEDENSVIWTSNGKIVLIHIEDIRSVEDTEEAKEVDAMNFLTAYLKKHPSTLVIKEDLPDNWLVGDTKGSVRLREGWNMVSVYTFLEAFERDDVSETIKAIYFYDREQGDYIRIFPKFQEDKWEMFVENNYYSENGDVYSSGALFNSAIWVYSSVDQVINFETEEGPAFLDYVGLKAGWNFLTITPEMIGHSLNEIVGDCNIETLAVWDSIKQSWDVASSVDYDDNIGESGLWQGFIMKVSNDCRLQSPPTAIAPIVPSLPDKNETNLENLCANNINVIFNSRNYFVGDNLEVSVEILDSNGNLMPNKKFYVDVYLDGKLLDGENYAYTDEKGLYSIDGEVEEDIVGEIKYVAYDDCGIKGEATVSIYSCDKLDLNIDGVIDANDAQVIADNLNSPVESVNLARSPDVNNDGKINILDIILIRNYFGKTCEVSAYPNKIGGYVLEDTSSMKDCDVIEEGGDLSVDESMVGQEICIESIELKYAQGNEGVFVSLSKITKGLDIYEDLLNLNFEPISIGSKQVWQPEPHNFIWFSSSINYNLISTQQFTRTIRENGESYSYGEADINHTVTSWFMNNY